MAGKPLIPVLSLSLLVAAALPFDPASAARIKCWTNKDGVRECGNAVPPEYAQKGHEEVSSGGLTVDRTQRARTTEEVEAERRKQAEEQASAQAEQRRYQRQMARDRVLLDTYVTEEDINYSSERKISAVESRIRHSRDHIGKLEETLAALQKKAANLERRGSAVPADLLASIEDMQRQISETETFISDRMREKADLAEQREADLERFRYLKDGGVVGSAPRS